MKQNEALEKAKAIFSENLRYYMNKKGKTQADIVADLGFKSSTVSAWVNKEKYARVDKMQTLADYFGVYLSDLREEKRSDENTKGLTRKDELIDSTVNILKQLPDDLKHQAYTYIQFLAEKQDRNKQQ